MASVVKERSVALAKSVDCKKLQAKTRESVGLASILFAVVPFL